MSTKIFAPIAIFVLLTVHVSMAQSQDSSSHRLPSIMGGVGVLYFNGDIGKGAGITAYSTIRGGYTFGVEERVVKFLGIQLSGIYGNLAASERSDDPNSNKNFQSTIMQGDLTINLHFDGFILKSNAVIAPFIYAGFSFMSFKTATDSLDANGHPYYYWTDGSIRNEAQNASDILTAKVIQRDYTYETPLNSGSTFCVPVGVGLKMRISDHLKMNVQAAYYFTFSKDIEHYSLSSANNKYLYSFFTLEYQFGKKPAEEANQKRYEGVDFSSMMKDTVKPKEANQQQLAKLDSAAAHADTSAIDRSAMFNDNPNLSFLKDLDKAHQQQVASNPNTASAHKLPKEFEAADKNHDGYISSQEITQVIDEFFDGTSPYTIADINKLIDYFFDQ
ncbi:MAG TPA: hypothetical protein VK806_02600 [Bacteroidia bacterium]|jgi:hypothetical protein|nr:hypothetical protein [Bacteroidia bacterium]